MPTSASRKPSGPRRERRPAPVPTGRRRPPPALEAFGRAPLAFEAHQTDPNVFVSHTPAYTLRVGPGYADILPATPAGSGGQVRMRLIDANAAIDGGCRIGPAEAMVNYIVGNEPSQWRDLTVAHLREKIRFRGRSTRASIWSTTALSAKSNTTPSSRPAPARAASRSASTGVDAVAVEGERRPRTDPRRPAARPQGAARLSDALQAVR